VSVFQGFLVHWLWLYMVVRDAQRAAFLALAVSSLYAFQYVFPMGDSSGEVYWRIEGSSSVDGSKSAEYFSILKPLMIAVAYCFARSRCSASGPSSRSNCGQ
jgi:hypothetical protein